MYWWITKVLFTLKQLKLNYVKKKAVERNSWSMQTHEGKKQDRKNLVHCSKIKTVKKYSVLSTKSTFVRTVLHIKIFHI